MALRLMALRLTLASLALGGWACTPEPIDFTGLACPCGLGWACVDDICVEPTADAGGDSGVLGDAGSPPTGLLAWFSFDRESEQQPGVFSDLSGLRLIRCEVPACPTLRPGKLGQALHFAGARGSVRLPEPAELRATTAHSIVFWLRAEDWTASTVLSVLRGDDLMSALRIDGAGRLVLTSPAERSVDPWYQLATDPGTIPLDTWIHVGIVLPGDPAEGCLFLNGEAAACAEGAIAEVRTGDIYLGSDGSEGTQPPLTGAIDELSIYTRDLEPSEIQRLASP